MTWACKIPFANVTGLSVVPGVFEIAKILKYVAGPIVYLCRQL